MLSTADPGSEARDSIYRVKIRNSAVIHPLDKKTTTAVHVASDISTIVRRHHEAGYLDAAVEHEIKNGHILYQVRPGSRHVIKEFILEGNRTFATSWMLRKLPFAAPLFFDRRRVESNIERLFDVYGDAGLPLVRISVRDSSAGTDTLIMAFVINEGPVVHLGGIDVAGNRATRDFVIRRMFALSGDSLFKSSQIRRQKARLFKTGLFSRIEESVVARDNQYYLRLVVDEQKQDYIEGRADYRPEPAKFNFDLNLNFFNLLGTARTFFLNYDHQGRDFGIAYGEPWLIFPARIRLSLDQETYDDRRKIRVLAQVLREIFTDFHLAAAWGIEDSRGERLQLVSLGTIIDQDRIRDTLRVEVGFYDRNDRRVTARIDGRHMLGDFVLANHLAWLWEEPIQEQNLFRLGGARTLRGYWEDEFLAEKAIWFSLEYKKFPLYPFLDGLAILDDGVASTERHLAYGIGVEARSRVLSGQLDVAFPAGQPWQDGKVHVRIERRL